MYKKELHPIYSEKFVGTWKRTSINGIPPQGDSFLHFYEDCTFEAPYDFEGTVNGNVDEVTVEEGDRNPIILIKRKKGSILRKGSILLTTEDSKNYWRFTLQPVIRKGEPITMASLVLILDDKVNTFEKPINRIFRKPPRGKKKMLSGS